MIPKTDYKIYPNYIEYEPKTPLELKTFIRTAIEISQYEKLPVHIKIDGGLYIIDAKFATDKLVDDYLNNINYRQHLSRYIQKLKGASK